jgi:arsenite oxidase small subunit
MERRAFLKLCAGTAALSAPLPALGKAAPRFYERVKLVDSHERPVHASALPVNRNFIFHYPYSGTPCFLLNLARPAGGTVTLATEQGQHYDWPGGVGPANSIVGYSAICAHRLAYPTREVSFISFRGQVDKNSHAHANTIHCCAEHSEYDPARGARVVGGPAKQPLAAILLEYDNAADELFALGTLGGELFNDFFLKYEFRLALEYGDQARQPVASTTVVKELRSFCRQEINC